MTQDVLLFTQNIEQAVQEIKDVGGRVTHRFSTAVFVAQLPQTIDVNNLQQSQSTPPTKLDFNEEIAIKAWQTSSSKSEDAAPSDTEGLQWDTPGFEPPAYDD